MAITIVASQNITASGTTSASAAHFNNTVVVGNAIIVGIVTNDTTTGATSVTDNAGSTYARQGTTYVNGCTIELWASLSCLSTGSATQTVTVNATTGDALAFVAQEVSGLAASSAFDKQAGTVTASGTTLTTPSVTTTTAAQLLLGIGVQTSSTRPFTQGTGYTMITQNTGSSSAGIALEYQIVAATGSYTAGMSIDTAQAWGLALFTLSATTVGGGAAPTPHLLSMMGVGA